MRLVCFLNNLKFDHIGASCHATAALFRVGLQWLCFLLHVDFVTVSLKKPIKIRIQPLPLAYAQFAHTQMGIGCDDLVTVDR